MLDDEAYPGHLHAASLLSLICEDGYISQSWQRPPLKFPRDIMNKHIGVRWRSVLALGATALLGVPAMAQVTPSDVMDLTGARAAGGESELASRGYVNVGGTTRNGAKVTTWWNDRRGVCLSVSTIDGRYDSLVSAPATECRQGSGGNFKPPEFGYGSPAGGGEYEEHIALICYGEGQRQTTQMQSGYEWDNSKKKYVPKSGYNWTTEDYNTSVTVEIDGDRGRIRPAKSMVPPLHSDSDGGWYPLKKLSISRDMIRGEFKFNGANSPKMTIDRRAGRIILDGLTKFSGTCDPLDGDRKF